MKLELMTPLKKELVRQAHISDIHFGAMDPKYQYELLTNQFTNVIRLGKYDLICINGDLFHKSYMAGSNVIYYAIKFIDDLADYCIENDTTLILLQGTASHDGNQLQLFYNYRQKEGLDLRVIQECGLIYAKGLRIMCIPEVYNMGEYYYMKLLLREAELAICHCMLEDLLPAVKINSEGLNSHAPIFNINHFSKIKLVMSGHVHNPGVFKNFHYCGSPYSWQFGEDLKKGFFLVDQYTTGEYKAQFVPIDSEKYYTINIDSKILVNNPEDIISYVNEYMNNVDNYRIEITVATSKLMGSIKVIREYYANNKKVKFKVNQVDKFDDNKDDFLDRNEKFAFILDKNLSPSEVLSRYIDINTGELITPEKILSVIKNN